MAEPGIGAVLEALLFVSGEPMEIAALAEAAGCGEPDTRAALSALQDYYLGENRGVVLQFVGDKVRMCTNRKYARYVEDLLQPVKIRSLSQSILETLAIIAYKQPVTRGEIEAIRGVRCEYAVQQLHHMGFIEDRGRKDVVGRPVLLGTTDRFLQYFDIASLDDLPSAGECPQEEDFIV